MDKKEYSQPQLIVHGDVEAITQQGNVTNADTPRGVANSAYPLGS